jgi:hypothetical protein
LPDLGLSGNRGYCADLLLLEGIDDAAFTDVGVSNQTDRNLLLVGMQNRELSQKLDKGTFTERVVDGCMEGDSRRGQGEMLDPSSLFTMMID